jgi:hypothetical protein
MQCEGVEVKSPLKRGRTPTFYRSFAYRGDSQFIRITPNNYSSYTILGANDKFTFSISPGHTGGYTFLNDDIKSAPRLGMVPVMTVQLRNSDLGRFKEAYGLVVRESFAHQGLDVGWFTRYVMTAGGIVSHVGQLEEGTHGWCSFTNNLTQRGIKVSVLNTAEGKWDAVTAGTRNLIQPAVFRLKKTLH